MVDRRRTFGAVLLFVGTVLTTLSFTNLLGFEYYVVVLPYATDLHPKAIQHLWSGDAVTSSLPAVSSSDC